MIKSVKIIISKLIVTVSLTSAFTISTFAQGLTYQPTNPSFGGNPLNNGFLVGTAQIQNQFVGSSGGGGVPSIDFPDINIDLGLGDNDTPDTSGDNTTGNDNTAGSDTTDDQMPTMTQ